jgi:carboxymethylenebutenolidase
MGKTIELTAGDGARLSAYVAEPAAPNQGAVVIVQEIFGVNSHIRSVVDDYAANGFLAIAPALFDRVERGIELDYSPESVEAGIAFAAKIRYAPALLDIGAALAWAESRAPGRVGVVGYCLGGTLAWLAATRLKPKVAVAYYGGQIGQFLDEKSDAPVLFHFGEQDSSIPLAVADAIRAHVPQSTVYVYPAGHGFSCDARASFEPASAQLAKTRSLEFLRAHLLAS